MMPPVKHFTRNNYNSFLEICVTDVCTGLRNIQLQLPTVI